MSAVQNNKDIRILFEEFEKLKKDIKELKTTLQTEKVKKLTDNKKEGN
jgi:cell fate (sporulation/competence/biofilm development) regulator YlbF (YheA/YmcA/DUF963 family)